jgi:molecular chaperone IbpA
MFIHSTTYDYLNQIEKYWGSTIEKLSLPSSIEKNADRTKMRIKIAAAGFSKDELSVSTYDNILVVKGEKKTKEKTDEFVCFSGNLAFRDFEKRFTLGEHVEVADVRFENGLLIIQLEVRLPESKRPKTFNIR